MNVMDIRRYEMLLRVREFGTAHADAFPASSIGGQMFAKVAAASDRLADHVAAQSSGRNAAKEATASKAAARAALRDALDAISHTARALALDTPGLDDKFRLPSSRNDQRLLAAARAFMQDAAPLTAAFVAHHLPETFLAELKTDIDAFEHATHDQSAGEDTHIAARASIEQAMDEGLTAVQRLDAIVTNRLRQDPAAMAVWTSARHVERTRTATPPAPPAPPLPAAPPATQPATPPSA